MTARATPCRVTPSGYGLPMRPDRAIEELTRLKDEAETGETKSGGEALTAWRGKVRGVLVSAVGADDHLVERFDKVRYSLGFWTERTPRSAYENARLGGIRTACGLIDAAVYQLRLKLEDGDEPTDARAYDPELWAHVKNLIDDQDWFKVASQTAIFVENHVRTWAGDPKGDKGESLVGKALYVKAFGDASELRLGARAGEHEGWRYLGMGFAQALSNVDRHRIQKREDARRYAIGVLGLGSLLLTQVRYEHPEIVVDPDGTHEA